MDVNATVDVGKNLTSLLERLAQQIGTTADKVFPWYVQQAHIEGVTTLAAFGVLLLVCLAVLAVSLSMALRNNDDGPSGTVAMISGSVLSIVLLIGSVESVDAVRKIANPNYYAMTMMTRDIGRLVAR